MKIQGTSPTAPIDTAATEGKARPAATGSPLAAPVDSVKLSSASTGGDSFDAAKVEAIKSAIAAGTFKVNPEAVADKLIAGVADLIAPRH